MSQDASIQEPPLARIARYALAVFFLVIASLKFVLPPQDGMLEFGGEGMVALGESLILIAGVVELAVGIALLTRWRVEALLVSTGLLLTFMSFLMLRLHAHGSASGCGCFGALEVSPSVHLAILLAALIPAFVALWGLRMLEPASSNEATLA